jgi:TorA maturation chaperone TorD
MIQQPGACQESTNELARECIYRFLSAVVAGPHSPSWEWVSDPENQELAIGAWSWIQPESDEGELDRLIDKLRASCQTLRIQYDKVFGLVVPTECPPYEAEYYPSQETFGRSQQMADVAGFYRAFGIEPTRASPERPDHLALELEFMAFLLTKRRLAIARADHDPEAAERSAVCEHALREFLRDHLAWWLPRFVDGLRRKAAPGYLDALATALAAWIPAECRRMDVSTVLRPVSPEATDWLEERSGCAACALHA